MLEFKLLLLVDKEGGKYLTIPLVLLTGLAPDRRNVCLSVTLRDPPRYATDKIGRDIGAIQDGAVLSISDPGPIS
ncbi:hypothetical protein RRG08_052340 [Elysia crispata]|uniref:Uncharacterized protein n=1 Tax=Elysia crispata TaxID=231223 RepID=A0AAE1A6B3_9GAST|nr:hypothetical protein RRG08_052340 [Elysia crispata]